MTELIRHQLFVFVMSVATGCILAAVYDAIRIYRNLSKCSKISCRIQEVLYWFVFAYLLFALTCIYNFGEFRAYIFVGTGIGVIAYYYTLGRVVVKYVTLMIDKIVNFLIKPLKMILKPIKLVLLNKLKCLKKRIKKWFDKKKGERQARYAAQSKKIKRRGDKACRKKEQGKAQK